ncbi:MAG: PDDEXK nuclease domain-containing protein [Saprospiraceae bacterium]|nr:PDDEXK nuclease domain-containing protein [Saprospiraceae bacterium]
MQNFKKLIKDISFAHNALQQQAANAINQALTIRNWLIGYHIVEFEQKGEDKAKYGDKLIRKLADELKNIKGLDIRALHNFRLFYQSYHQIGNYLIENQKVGTVSAFFIDKQKVGTLSPLLPIKQIQRSLTAKSGSFNNRVSGEQILTKLSYSHLEQLIRIKDDLKRTFYEIECIKGIWSVRELKRQISSLYYERSGLSAKPEKLSELVNQNTKPQVTTDIIKNIYAFEFLDLKIKDIVEESDLETALIDHLQEFILEMGNGFCFEARQKRILIGEKYYFIDLVFYHRILKCHVLVDLKIGAFEHGDIGQLNTYLNYYKQHFSEANDNYPVGILLVADKDNALVKYATAGMDENLFVQQYLIQLPAKKQLEQYINNELKKLK